MECFVRCYGEFRYTWQVQECSEAETAADVILLRRSQLIQPEDPELLGLILKSKSKVSMLLNFWEAF